MSVQKPTAEAFRFAAKLETKLREVRMREGSFKAREAGARDLAVDGVEPAFEDVAVRAALSGRFGPEELFQPGGAAALKTAVLSRLAPLCLVYSEGRAVKWLLHQDLRRQILSRLVQEKRLPDALRKPLPATDGFGEMLRRLLSGKAVFHLESMPWQDLLGLAWAVEVTSGLNIQTPDPVELQRLIARARFLSENAVLLEKGFVGRTDQLNQLEKFLAGEGGDQILGRVRAVILAGVGGAGKSTLLAKFIQRLLNDQRASVVILDFDKPGIDATDTYWLEMEMARQIGAQYPGSDSALRQSREAARGLKSETDQATQSYTESFGEATRAFRAVVDAIRLELQAAAADRRPFLLVLDTFEEVAHRKAIDKVMDWISEVAERLWPIGLNVAFSGRLFDATCATLARYGLESVIKVDELEPQFAEQLLLAMELNGALAKRIATSQLLPRRPLELKLLSRVLRSGNIATLEELEAELRKGGSPARELFAGLVYRRVLLRVSEETRSLAYPGLVMRYITKDLIQKVLVPALDLEPMSDAQVQKALDNLAGYEWLAYQQGDEIWHRKDLRRSMLKVMIGNERDKARRINRSAADYFETSGNDRDAAEALYHRLMLVESSADGASFQLAELRKAFEYIGGDIVDLPPPGAVLMRFAIGSDLSVDEVPLLPPDHLHTAYHSVGERSVHGREFGLALTLIGKAAHLVEGPMRPWEVEALYSTASWDELRGRRLKKSAPNAVVQLLNVVYPDAIISPDRVDTDEFEARAGKGVQDSADTIAPGEMQTFLERLALCSLLLHHDRGLGNSTVEALWRIFEGGQVRQSGFPEALVGRRVFLVNKLRGDRRQQSMPMAVPPMLVKLAKRQIEELVKSGAAKEFKPGTLQSIAARVADITRGATRGRASARGMLGDLNALARDTALPSWIEINLDRADGGLLELLFAGPDPEFRNPCRFALLDAFSDDAGHKVLRQIFGSTIPLPLEDFNATVSGASVPTDSEHAIESYVELADHTGMLGALMGNALKARPKARKLRDVAEAHSRWRDAIHRILWSQ